MQQLKFNYEIFFFFLNNTTPIATTIIDTPTITVIPIPPVLLNIEGLFFLLVAFLLSLLPALVELLPVFPDSVCSSDFVGLLGSVGFVGSDGSSGFVGST